MSIFGKAESKKSREPSERSVIVEGGEVIVDLWVDDHRKKLNWSFSRVDRSGNNPRGFRTMKLSCLSECAIALAAICRVGASFQGCTPQEQRFYAYLGDALDNAVESVKDVSDGPSNEGGTGLLSAVRG